MKTKKVSAEFDLFMNKLDSFAFEYSEDETLLKVQDSEFSVNYTICMNSNGIHLSVKVNYKNELINVYGCQSHIEIDEFSAWFCDKKLSLLTKQLNKKEKTRQLGKTLFNNIG